MLRSGLAHSTALCWDFAELLVTKGLQRGGSAGGLSLGESEHTPGQAHPWLHTLRVWTLLSILDSRALTT